MWRDRCERAVGDDHDGHQRTLAVAFGRDGTLFVANAGDSTVTAYAPPYTGQPADDHGGRFGPVALGRRERRPDRRELRRANVTIYPPPYTTTSPVALNTGQVPAALALDATQHLWIVSCSGALYRYPAPYAAGGFDEGSVRRRRVQPAQRPRARLHRTPLRRQRRREQRAALRPAVLGPIAVGDDLSTAGQPMTQPANVIVGVGDTCSPAARTGSTSSAPPEPARPDRREILQAARRGARPGRRRVGGDGLGQRRDGPAAAVRRHQPAAASANVLQSVGGRDLPIARCRAALGRTGGARDTDRLVPRLTIRFLGPPRSLSTCNRSS